MKPLNAGQIIILLIVGLVTVAYLSARSYSNKSNDVKGDFDILMEKSFQFDDQDSIVLTLSSENIYVTSGSADTFEIRYENHVFSEKAKEAMLENVIIEETGSSIKVYRKADHSINMNWIDSLFYFMDNGFKSDVMSGKLEVILPKGYDQKMVSTTSSGNNSLMDLNISELIVSSSSGNIEVMDSTSDELKATTSSGRISITDVKVDGNLVAKTSSGNQSLDQVEAKDIVTTASSGTIRFTGESDQLQATTSSGNIHVELDSIVDDYDIQSSSGTINLTVPRNAAFTFESRTSSGNFKPEIDLSYSTEDEDYAKGYYNKKGADAHIQLSSTSGNQYLKD